MKFLSLLLLLSVGVHAQQFSPQEIKRFVSRAKNVSIIRDIWGIPHIYGKTDADAVFGLMYAQCEDDFKRVEMNYIEKLGRMAEVKGESELYNDLLIKLVIDSAAAIKDYNNSPAWMKKLLDAFADGMNFYLYKNPSVKPILIARYKAWYPLLWTDGSISAINSGGLTNIDLKNFYSGSNDVAIRSNEFEDELTTGSNGFSIAPSKSESGNALLYINPHVTFYFRSEVQVVSEEGLNAYGAVTWGQFFVYQGFNQHCGWMHTSGYSDVADLYAEKISRSGDSLVYLYDGHLKKVGTKEITLKYLSGNSLITKKIKTYFTHHGPVMAKRNHEWISLRAMNRSLNGLIQSWNRTKCKNFQEFKKNMELVANCSNNTTYADDQGNIAYWHGNFIPKRDSTFNWSEPVDGTSSKTEWKGLHKLDEIIHVYNPATGWTQNCNSTPYTVSGTSSPKREDYPFYMSTEGENFRGVNAARLMEKSGKLDLDKLIALGYDTYLSAFEDLIPALAKAYDKLLTSGDSSFKDLEKPLSILKGWDLYSAENSVATTVAIEWGQKLMPYILKVELPKNASIVDKTKSYAATSSASDLLKPLREAVSDLNAKYGTWEIPWGDINRYQRLTGKIDEIYDDNKPSIPSGMASSTWGCLPSFVSHYVNGTKKRYGYNGNSFICAVEFGKRVNARSLLTGGESGDPTSKHFNDQELMYTKGKFKDVLFYKEDVLKHVERTYHPGE
ncbi:MAG: acylase [Bacteroidetes bacterium]|nr:MAG: acylase [Bacteroidota bacterium]